jgi:hypothetical protein
MVIASIVDLYLRLLYRKLYDFRLAADTFAVPTFRVAVASGMVVRSYWQSVPRPLAVTEFIATHCGTK